MTQAAGSVSIGVDIGGTFTDVVLVHADTGRAFSAKVLTTPEQPAAAVLAGVARVLEQARARIEDARTIVHGTTLATNAIIERKGARTGLVTTRGFRDVLETAKELRYDLYDLFIEFPEPLVPRRWRLGVAERTAHDGAVLTPLDERDMDAAVDHLLRDGVESVAVCLLHSYANPANEQAAERVLRRRRPELPVSLSSRVLPEVGEYGRVSTTVANAYVRPLVARYLLDLVEALARQGSRAAFFVMSSGGGTLSVEMAREFPVRLVESGPAAGVSVATFYAERSGARDLLAFDMGGTTAKISLITGGQPTRTTELEVARVRRFQKGSGLLIKSPAVDLIEIGAGGGSIARVGALGLLAVGPESAGADPGPACYGRGGEAATVTDADLVLGYLDPAYFLGGAMPLDRERAAAAIARSVGTPLGLAVTPAARSVYEVVNDNMANAAAVYAAEQGIDLRGYALLAFGGAAPSHAWDVARRLGIREVRVPFAAGVLSALGCLLSPVSFDFVFGYMRELRQVDWALLRARYDEMEREGRRFLAEAGIVDGIAATYSADMRYFGQRYEVNVPLPGAAGLGAELLPALHAAFYEAYRQHYGREIREVPVETVSWRLTVAGPRPAPALGWPEDGRDGRGLAPRGRRAVVFGETGPVECAVYDRYALRPGDVFDGPAVVEDRESTTVVPPGARARVDDLQSVVIALVP